MRKVFTALTLIAALAIIGFGIRTAVFAQDATPIAEGTPTAEPTVAPQPATPEPTGPEVVTLVFIERATTDTVIDLGETGDSIGDLLAFGNEVFDETNTTKVGDDQGSCVLTKPGEAYECEWTLILEDGQIVVQGPFLTTGDSVLAITGGTGIYAGVRGQMTLSALSETEFKFTYELQ